MHDIQIHGDFQTSFQHFFCTKKTKQKTTSHGGSEFGGKVFVFLTSFTGSVVERSRTALRERKKRKKLREKKIGESKGFGRIWTKFPNCPGPEEPWGLKGNRQHR